MSRMAGAVLPAGGREAASAGSACGLGASQLALETMATVIVMITAFVIDSSSLHNLFLATLKCQS